MFSNKFSKLIPTIIFVLVAVSLSIILFSYFNINFIETSPGVLNRKAVFEGFQENNVTPNMSSPISNNEDLCNEFLTDISCNSQEFCTWFPEADPNATPKQFNCKKVPN
jgi:hypothetical protein